MSWFGKLLRLGTLSVMASPGLAQSTLSQTDVELLGSIPAGRMLVADLDGNGQMDVVAIRSPSGAPEHGDPAVVVQRRVDGQNFRISHVLGATLPEDLVLADLDGDGDLDLVVVEDSFASALQIWINQDGHPQRDSSQQFAYDLASGACALRQPETALRRDLLLTRGVGRDSIWLQAQPAPLGTLPQYVERQRLAHPGAVNALCEDFDGDGLDDILIYGNETRLWLRRPEATPPFVESSGGNLLPGVTVFAASARDLDGDGRLDMVLATANHDIVLRQVDPNGNGHPLFTQVAQLDAPGGTQEYQWMDVDGDGQEDLIALRDNVNAPLATRGSAVILRQGLIFNPTPVQRLVPARSGAVAPLATGQPPHLWLASLVPDNNSIWASGQPQAPTTVRFAPREPGRPQAYYMAGRIGADVEIAPQAQVPFHFTLQAGVGDGPSSIHWSTPVASGQSALRSIFSAPTGAFNLWQVNLTATVPADAAQIGQPSSTVVGILSNPYASQFVPSCYLLCAGFGACGTERPDATEPSGSEQLWMANTSEITLLQRLRDERMASSAGGQHYIALYQALTLDLYGATFVDPRFYLELWDLKDAWMPAVENLLDGDGQMTISAEMQSRLQAALLRFQSDGSAALRDAIEAERRALDLDRIAGRPISWLQQRWESTPLLIDGFE